MVGNGYFWNQKVIKQKTIHVPIIYHNNQTKLNNRFFEETLLKCDLTLKQSCQECNFMKNVATVFTPSKFFTQNKGLKSVISHSTNLLSDVITAKMGCIMSSIRLT